MSMMINPARFGAGQPVNWSPFYDVVTGQAPVGAWGTRRLVSGYTGALVRIRDTATNIEQDVSYGADGLLGPFMVTGNAAVVTIYDQSGNGNHLTQTNTSRQPLLVRSPISFSGKPAIRFDGTDDFMHDAATSTAKAYMVASPIIALEGSGRNGGASFCPMAGIPHVAGSNTSPFYRWSINRRLFTSALEFRLTGTASAVTSFTPELNNGFSIGVILFCAQIDRIIDGVNSFNGPRAVGDTVTYPNATGLRLGANGAGGEASNYEFEAIVILPDATSDETTVRSWHDNIHNRNAPLSDNLVMNLPLTAGAAVDTSVYAHPAKLSGTTSLAGGYFAPGSDGAVVVAPSGLNNVSGDFTFEAEVQFTAMTLNRNIAARKFLETSSNGWYFGTHDANSGELMVVVNASHSASNYIVTGTHGSSAALTTGVWYRVRVTLSGSTWRIYVDGVLRAERAVGVPSYNAQPFLIGNGPSRNRAFPGYIRNVKMWSGVALLP